ncbi:MAG: AAA family ATPase [Candidatus Lokiarchaeota archaeon]|nr:AAA family ATPase [Candidatus Lokiarchaeota archaeon]
MVNKNYLEEEFRTSSLFLDESVFESEYIPKVIKHRDNELVFLSRLFLPLLSHPLKFSKKILIIGNVGVGKTVTIGYFGKMIQQSAQKRKLNLKFVHLNCRHNRSSSHILKKIVNELVGGIPNRGLSNQDLIDILVEYLQEHKCHLILVLDELGYLMKKDSNLIYTLSRFNEMTFSEVSHLSLIGIVKDLLTLRNLDNATVSTLQNEVIRFKKYTEKQIMEILRDRAELGLKPGVVDDSILFIISSLSSISGDMRKALNLLRNAVRYAEHNKIDCITAEIIQIVNAEFESFSINELTNLNRQVLLLYKSVCNLLSASKSQITMNEIKEEYFAVCKQHNNQPRSDTQIWGYLQQLKRDHLLSINFRNKNQQGRRSYYSIPRLPVKTMLKQVEMILDHSED